MTDQEMIRLSISCYDGVIFFNLTGKQRRRLQMGEVMDELTGEHTVCYKGKHDMIITKGIYPSS